MRVRLLQLASATAFLAAVLLAPVAMAAPEGASSVAAPLDARSWLGRIQAAAKAGNYQGTMVFTVAGTMSSSRVLHYVVGEQTFERLEMLDGRQQRIVRHNDIVQTIWPQSRMAVVEKRETLGAWSTTPQEVQPANVLENYDIRRQADSRVAGHEVAVFMLEPRDQLRYPQRLWADIGSGLMLRADVLGLPAAAGAGGAPAASPALSPAVVGAGATRVVLESTAFSEVVIGVKPLPDVMAQVLNNTRNLEGYRVLRPQQQRTTLEAEGWGLAAPVGGFKLAGCVRRGMDASGDDEAPVLQSVFTDGLTHVSVFVETFRPQRHRSEALAQRGATATLTQRRGEYWITAVGDVPPATLRLFASALERKRP